MNDLFQTLDRMGIMPGGGTATGTSYTEHRVIRATLDERDPRVGDVVSPRLPEEPVVIQTNEPEIGLAVGDRVLIRYLDDPRARPEFYRLINRPSDTLNGLLSIHSPLAGVLAEASPGDEITIRIDGRDRPLLYMSLDREAPLAA